MLPDFQYVLAHPDILSELPAIRGLLRRRYPTLQNGLFKDLVYKVKELLTKIIYFRFINIGFGSYDKTFYKRY